MKVSLLSAGLLLASTPGHAGDGQALYAEYCLSCHQADGYGVPNFQPEIIESDWLKGDAEASAWFVLQGSAAVPESGYENVMPGFAQLSDAKLAALLSYVRDVFGKTDDAAVAIADVAAARERIAGD